MFHWKWSYPLSASCFAAYSIYAPPPLPCPASSNSNFASILISLSFFFNFFLISSFLFCFGVLFWCLILSLLIVSIIYYEYLELYEAE